MDKSGISFEEFSYKEMGGENVVFVAIDDKPAGVIKIADSLKKNAKRAVAILRDEGYEIYILTGDNMENTRNMADLLGIEKVIVGVLPDKKAEEVMRLQKDGMKIAFVGDGINDAPALAQADVGIAIGAGTDIAIESGDMVLMHSDPLDIVAALQLTKKIVNKIKQNIFWAFAYNSALIPLAAGLFYSYTISPELAAMAMALSSVTVVTLSLMLRGWKPEFMKLRCAEERPSDRKRSSSHP